ncbi:DUF6031 family protein [Streptosporangium sp. NPDC006930]|uniref:DUF6031 family protein n=1 Tax=unclassified Streptosporangium TaxID=2632669 RepID=UPI00343B0D46
MNAADIPVFPQVRAGHARPVTAAVEAWIQAAWLMLAEGRSYIEDIEGGTDQPQMQSAVKLRLLEQLVDVDNRLAGRVPVADAHCLALGLEYGLQEVAQATGTDLIEIFALAEEFGGPGSHDEIFVFWERLLEAFPGELPDRLIAQGQRDMLVTLRSWAALSRAAGLDIGFLTPFMKES